MGGSGGEADQYTVWSRTSNVHEVIGEQGKVITSVGRTSFTRGGLCKAKASMDSLTAHGSRRSTCTRRNVVCAMFAVAVLPVTPRGKGDARMLHG